LRNLSRTEMTGKTQVLGVQNMKTDHYQVEAVPMLRQWRRLAGTSAGPVPAGSTSLLSRRTAVVVASDSQSQHFRLQSARFQPQSMGRSCWSRDQAHRDGGRIHFAFIRRNLLS
jgi:hypothetical protein